MRPVLAVAAALVLTCCLAAPARADDADVVYDPATVTTFDVSLSQASIDRLIAAPKDWADGSLALTLPDGTVLGPYAVGVRTKGNATLQPITDKAALRFKFNHSVSGQKVLGLKQMTLNNMLQDDSHIRETVSYAMMETGGVPAARTGYAYVRVNGQGRGLYLNLERYDDLFLQREGLAFRHLLEGEPSADFTAQQRRGFSVDEGDEDDLGDLDAAVAAAGGWPGNGSAAFDRDRLTRFFAAESFVGHWDSYSNLPAPPSGDPDGVGHWRTNNFYAYSTPAGRFSLIPSGMDQTLLTYRTHIGDGQGVLFVRCMADAGCAQAFRNELLEFGRKAQRAAVGATAETAARTVAAWRACPALRQPGATPWRDQVWSTYGFLRERRAQVHAYLGYDGSPTPIAAPTTTPAPAATCPAPPVADGTPEPGDDGTPTPVPDPGGDGAPGGEAPGAGEQPPAATPSAGDGDVAGEVRARSCVVPQMRGRTLARARKLLRASGCRPSTVIRRGDGKRVRRGGWRVRTAKPGFGARRASNARIVLVLVPKR